MNQNKIEWQFSRALIGYPIAIEIMEERVRLIINEQYPELIWFLEHPPVYTAGTSARNEELLENGDIPVYSAGRGGKYTYHGPGQRVVYLMLNLKQGRFKADVREYVYCLEESMIGALKKLGIESFRRDKRIGIWVDHPQKGEAKIAAIGIRVRKWVTYHGLAININPDLSKFGGIVPCGISEYGVTSLSDLGYEIDKNIFDKILVDELTRIFGI